LTALFSTYLYQYSGIPSVWR